MTAEQENIMKQIHEVNFKLLAELDRLCRKHNITYYLTYGGLLGAVRHGDFIPWDNDVDVIMTREEFNKLEEHFNELGEDFEYIDPEDYGKNYFDMVPRINYVHSEIYMPAEKAAFYENKNNKIALDFFLIDPAWKDVRQKLYQYYLMVLYAMANGHRHGLELDNYSPVMKVAAVVLATIGKIIPSRCIRKWMLFATHHNKRKKPSFGYIATNETMSFGKYYPKEIFDGYEEVEIRGTKFMVPAQPKKFLELEYGNYMELPPEEKRIPHFGYFELDVDKIWITK